MCAIKNLCETTGIVQESANDAVKELKVKELTLRWNLEGRSKTMAVNINGERIRCKFSYI